MEAYIELPPEDAEEGMVGLLLRTMYGTRDAAMAFDRFATVVMEGAGYVMGMSTPCVYRHKSETSVAWRHGDDIIVAGEPHFVDHVTANLKESMRLKIRARMGFGPGEDRHIAVLNRLLSLDVMNGRQVLRIEPDPRHAALIVRQAGLDGDRAKGVTTPGEKGGDYHNLEPLTEDSDVL